MQKSIYRVIKISLFIIGFLFVACEDKKEEAHPLVGTWTSTSMDYGSYMQVTTNQIAYFPWLEATGDFTVKEYDNGVLSESTSMSYMDIDENEDLIWIGVTLENDSEFYEYSIVDYISSMDDWDMSRYTRSTGSDYYDYRGSNYDYSYTSSNRTFTLNFDTLYRAVYTSQGEFIDSTRMAFASGSLTTSGMELTGGTPIKISAEEEFVDNGVQVVIQLIEDGTGWVTESVAGYGSEREALTWVGTDSTLTMTFCYGEDDEGEDCNTSKFSYSIDNGMLTLVQRMSLCEGISECLREAEQSMGLDEGTLVDYWFQIKLIFNQAPSVEKILKNGKKRKVSRLFQNHQIQSVLRQSPSTNYISQRK